MFTVKRSHALQWRARLDVIFQSHYGNFSVVGTYFDDSAKVYHSNAVIAEVLHITTYPIARFIPRSTHENLSKSCFICVLFYIVCHNQVKEKTTFGGFFKGKQDFVVRINAGVDYAFIVSLLVILNETNTIF